MTFQDVIAHRMSGLVQSADELRLVAEGAAKGSVPDYQLSAWLMAACFKPLSIAETADLTKAIAASGRRLDLGGLPKPWIDKHSTGGVGDKTTIVLLPLLAAGGLTTVKMSGRGLGITGGTVDKMESIPGFRIDLSPDEMVEQARKIGIAWSGQTPELAPADKALYALRDATETVENIPLIVSSILGKKIAGGAELVGIDVKAGSGGFMKNPAKAEELAKALVEVGARCGLHIYAEITDMSQPLGRTAGNALEVLEAIEVLNGAQGRFTELCLQLASEAFFQSKKSPSRETGYALASKLLSEGDAKRKAGEWFAAQGSDPALLDGPGALQISHVTYEVKSRHSGYAANVDAGTVGRAVIAMGGGRHQKDDHIDHSVGIETMVSVGDKVDEGQVLFKLRCKVDHVKECAEMLEQGFVLSQTPVEAPPLVLRRYP